MTTYNHAYTIAFEVPGSTCEDASDVTHERLMQCLLARLSRLSNPSVPSHYGESMVDACDAPFDTYEEPEEGAAA